MKKLLIFAGSFRGIRRKDDNLYDLLVVSSLKIKQAITS